MGELYYQMQACSDDFVSCVIKGIIIRKGGQATTKQIFDDYAYFVGQPCFLAKASTIYVRKYLEKLCGLTPLYYTNSADNVWYIKYCLSKYLYETMQRQQAAERMKDKIAPPKPPRLLQPSPRLTRETINLHNELQARGFGRQGHRKSPRKITGGFLMNESRQKTNSNVSICLPSTISSSSRYKKKLRRSSSTKNTASLLYDYELMGDDFFLEICRVELKKKIETTKRVRHCGLCVSGQTIKAAAKRLSEISNKTVIINIGSVDILHGQQLIDMQYDFKHLVQVCKKNNISLIITTLAPLGNRSHYPELRNRLEMFNKYLIDNYSRTHKVIDISKCMIGTRGETIYDCYQPEPKYMTGTNQPHLLWNHIGRQLIFHLIRKKIAD